MIPSHPETPRIGREFHRRLIWSLGKTKVRQILKTNAARSDGSCASHDFLDANEVMAEAWLAVWGRDCNLQSPDDCSLWSAAWGHWQASGLLWLKEGGRP